MQKNGNPFGFQEITGLEDESSISFILKSKGPPHRPELHFHLTAVDSSTTRVVLHFRNEIMRPFNLIQRLAGIVRWTREMHRKDLDGLKRYVERQETYTGRARQSGLT